MLELGIISSRQGAQKKLMIIARGPQHNEVKFKVTEIMPDWLQVDFGPTREINNGAATRTPLTIRIPKGSPPANYLGPDETQFGKIVIETNHPEEPELQILVRFAVEG